MLVGVVLVEHGVVAGVEGGGAFDLSPLPIRPSGRVELCQHLLSIGDGPGWVDGLLGEGVSGEEFRIEFDEEGLNAIGARGGARGRGEGRGEGGGKGGEGAGEGWGGEASCWLSLVVISRLLSTEGGEGENGECRGEGLSARGVVRGGGQ